MLVLKIDNSAVVNLGNMLAAAGKQAPHAIRRAINHTGDKARTQMIRVLTGQTGLQRKTIVKALKVTRANFGSLSYTITSRGGNISLKYFGARETQKGVSAAPWNNRRVYPGTFLKGGRFPNRVSLALGGHAFQRTGAGRTPITKVKSGLYIPEEMISGASAQAFYGTAESELPGRLAHELYRILG